MQSIGSRELKNISSKTTEKYMANYRKSPYKSIGTTEKCNDILQGERDMVPADSDTNAI